jgi:hypothetical protein
MGETRAASPGNAGAVLDVHGTQGTHSRLGLRWRARGGLSHPHLLAPMTTRQLAAYLGCSPADIEAERVRRRGGRRRVIDPALLEARHARCQANNQRWCAAHVEERRAYKRAWMQAWRQTPAAKVRATRTAEAVKRRARVHAKWVARMRAHLGLDV